MAMMQLEVTFVTGDPVVVNITPKVIVDAERHFKMGMSKLFGENSSMEHMTWLAWKGMLVGGYEVKTYELWLDNVANVGAASTQEAGLPLPTP